ncbi:MAG TPA: polysaccharide biosynthesis/export family protein [Pyrinomonadaceae bacterium]|nr:polysaccharide biosynthesis/export family protein [Acidobacteriota bacterium]HQZ98553.1 polysaccharide biosynthesis/export family protein [Pyrinomonadaceae bacterium]
MKAMVLLRNTLIISASLLILSGLGFGQTETAKNSESKAAKEPKTRALVPLPAPSSQTDKTDEAAEKVVTEDILPYYNNYLKEYRLGPSDVISVEVFGQCPDYCIMSKPIPPNAKISYPLIREGVLVAGRTVEQVAAEITKKLDEFIIDPKVTVTLEKAMSTRYSVMGNVALPGVRVMDRKVSVYEAIIESGGVTKNGNKDKVYVVSYGKDGRLTRQQVSLAKMEAGKADMVFLNPGDQVFVAGKGFTIEKFFDVLGKASAARLLFGSPL